MNSPDARLDWVVGALHRRQVALRVAERAGLGLLGGCGVAVVLVPLLLGRGQSAWGVAGAALGIGAGGGAAWGAARRPDALAAAAEADRQLGTADLLGTAWAMRRASPDEDARPDAWRRSVLALAAARCGAVSPSAVLLRRFGGRAWGGIALAVALVVTLASFSSGPLRANPNGQQLADARSRDSSAAARPILQRGTDVTGPQRRAEQNPGDERARDSQALDAEPPEDDQAKPTAGDRESDASPQAATSGAGDGTGRSEPDKVNRPTLDPVSDAADENGPQPRGDRAAGGTGRAARDPGEREDGAGGSLAEAETARAAPPRQHGQRDAAVEAAGEAHRAGRVGDEYRDLVRGYFDRPAAVPPASER